MVAGKPSKATRVSSKGILLTSTDVRLFPRIPLHEKPLDFDLRRANRLQRIIGPLIDGDKALDLSGFGYSELVLIEEVGRSLLRARDTIGAEVGLDVSLAIRDIRQGSIEIFGIEVSAPKHGLASWLAIVYLAMECVQAVPPTWDAITELQNRIQHVVHGEVRHAVNSMNAMSARSEVEMHAWEANFSTGDQPSPEDIFREASRLVITRPVRLEDEYDPGVWRRR